MKEGANSQVAKNTYSYFAIRVALILAIVCIGINTWVLINVYRNGDTSDPTLAAVEALGDDLDSQISSIGQRLLILEQRIAEWSHVSGSSEEVLSALAKLDVLEKQFASVQAAVQEQPEQFTKVMEAIAALQQSIATAFANLGQQIDEKIDQKLAAKVNNPPNPAGFTTITVRRGDTIWELASQFEDPPSKAFIERILEYNMITDPTKLQVGQKIIIPQS